MARGRVPISPLTACRRPGSPGYTRRTFAPAQATELSAVTLRNTSRASARDERRVVARCGKPHDGFLRQEPTDLRGVATLDAAERALGPRVWLVKLWLQLPNAGTRPN